MTLEEARRIIAEIHDRYGIQFSDYQEDRREGVVKFVNLTLRLKIDQDEKPNLIKRIPAK